MKTVTGGVIAAEPISLPKAATILSGFVSSKNGASQDVGAYLRRASAAFSELRSLHVELKSSPLKKTQISSDVTHERNQGRKKKKKKSEESIEDDESVVVGKVKEKLKTCEKSMEVEVEIEKERRKEKKKKRKSEKEMHCVEKTSKKKSKAKEIN